MTTFTENKAAIDVLVSEVESIEAQAQIAIDAKQSELAVLAETIAVQEETCGHVNWTKEGTGGLQCDTCGKVVLLLDPTILWPWASVD